ncbi:PucR family transcriptional regulator [Rathayibacter soli]|uniref:PucR family transcriptional regulator n=1 Tax=Rathayibacter soli TaxID=3144168 RepID=UPI0027E3C44A|nr:PucR family transcriptional regulator [Glaciibacter superstes]
MPATVRRLLGDPALGLRLLTPEAQLPTGILGLPVSWVHSSDLPDPTPFLSPGQVLLTTGTQFPADDDSTSAQRSVDDYVSRLITHGIVGLGFGADVVRAGMPQSLIDACRQQGLPLFEVPYRTPFIAVARLAADIAAQDAYARSTWALRAQRAISVAATRPDGLSATLSELSRQLDHWVALFDAAGTLDRMFPHSAVPPTHLVDQGTIEAGTIEAGTIEAGTIEAGTVEAGTIVAVRAEAVRLLRRGQRASATVSVGAETLTLQTLGARGRLRGILVFGGSVGGSAGLDEAGQQVVTSVVALAGLALEQNHTLDRARAHLRTGLLRLLANGEIELAENISREMWGALPFEPVIAAVADLPVEQMEAIAEQLELRAADASGRLFFAMDGPRMVLCVSADSPALVAELADELGLRIGVSEPQPWAELSRALAQADHALDRARVGDAVTDFADVAARGMLALLDGSQAREVGLQVLAPLLGHDQVKQSELMATLRSWLSHNGEYEAAARELGVHRHTVRARIGTIERLLGRDLSPFQTRAELWAAQLAVETDAADARAAVLGESEAAGGMR